MRKDMMAKMNLDSSKQKGILKSKKQKSKSPPYKKKELRFDVAYDEKGVEKKAKEDTYGLRGRSRGRQTQGQKDSQSQAGAKK